MTASMSEKNRGRGARAVGYCGVLGGAAIVLFASGCGSSAVTSGVAVGKLGSALSGEALGAPRGGAVCAYQEALATPSPGGADKPTSETCAKALKSDQLWRRTMIVLGAYSAKLEAIASGGNPETAGQLQGALTRVNDANWAQPDGAQETAARDAVLQLATQLKSNTSKGDLAATIKEAAPHVSTLCDGLGAFLDAQVKSVGDLQADIDKKRATHADRRCALLDGKNVCVQESVLDRMTYASVFGDLGSIESSHLGARDTVSSFCAAHKKLEEAAQNGNLSKDKTFQDIVEAVSAVTPAQPRQQGALPATKPSAAPEKK